jgi:hypothetical protein
MALYSPPSIISEIFNVDNYNNQEDFLSYKELDQRYLRPIKKIENKTTGISYNNSNLTTNVSSNINIDNLLLTKDAAIRDDVCIGESLSIGSNLCVGKNIVNSGDIFTNKINAKSITFINAFIEDIAIKKDSISFIKNLSSDVQLQIDNMK